MCGRRYVRIRGEEYDNENRLDVADGLVHGAGPTTAGDDHLLALLVLISLILTVAAVPHDAGGFRL